MNLPQVYPCSPSWTLLHPPSPYPPSGSSQCTSPKPEPGLATHFIHDIIHVSMPFSQISSPSPSPAESIRLILSSMINGLPRAFSSHSINKSAAEVSENTRCLLGSRPGAGTLFLLMFHGQNKPQVHLTRSEVEEIYSAFSGKDYNITGQRGIQGAMDSDKVNRLYHEETWLRK